VVEISLREFRFPEDYPAVLDLWQHAGPGIHVRRSDEPGEIQKKLRRDPDLFLVAEAAGKIVGSVVGGFDGRRGLIYHLAVAAEYRKAGTGSLLMEEVERRLRAHGCIRCYLMVAEDNLDAIRFYEKRGWEPMNGILTYAKDL
jgi:ribosomal protein S18 acetylase RimI-like enzyme